MKTIDPVKLACLRIMVQGMYCISIFLGALFVYLPLTKHVEPLHLPDMVV